MVASSTVGVPNYYGHEATGIAQDDTGVDVALPGDKSLRAAYSSGATADAV